MRRRSLLRSAGAVGGLAALGRRSRATPYHQESGGGCPPGQEPRGDPRAYEDYAVREVPADYDTIQAAVDAADPRDLGLVDEGVYREAVTVETPRVTVRGRDRNAVVLDGGFERAVAPGTEP